MRAGQRRPPAPHEAAAIHRLERLHPHGDVAAVRHALEMHHLRPRLVQRLQPHRAQAEAQIGVLEIGGRVARIEPSQPQEYVPRHHQRRAGAIVHLPQVVVLRPARIVMPAIVPAGTIVPDDAAGFLQRAIRVQQLGANRADIAARSEHRQHAVQPSRQHLRVIVQEQQPLPARGRRGRIARTQEADIDRITQQPDAADLLQAGGLCPRKGIVHHDDFDRGSWRMRLDRRQAAHRVIRLPIARHDDRYLGPIAHRQQQRRRLHRIDQRQAGAAGAARRSRRARNQQRACTPS